MVQERTPKFRARGNGRKSQKNARLSSGISFIQRLAQASLSGSLFRRNVSQMTIHDFLHRFHIGLDDPDEGELAAAAVEIVARATGFEIDIALQVVG